MMLRKVSQTQRDFMITVWKVKNGLNESMAIEVRLLVTSRGSIYWGGARRPSLGLKCSVY